MKGLIALLVLSLVGKVSTECNGKPVHAACNIEPGKESNVTGTIDFRQKMTFGCFASGSMEVLLDLKGFEKGSNPDHGIQVKTYGDTSHGCATTGYTYSADDGHGVQMLGDLGTLPQDGEGNMYTMIKNKKAKLSGPLSIIGRAVVVYDGSFNPFSQNPINAPILGCCVIGYSDGSRWTASRNSAVTSGSSLPPGTGVRSGIHHAAPPHHPQAPHPSASFHQPTAFHNQHPAMSDYHQQPQQDFSNDFGLGGHDSIFGGSPISHHQPVFAFGGSTHDQAHDRFNRGGSLGPHIPDFDKAQSTPIYKRREGDIRSPLFGEDPKPLFGSSHSSFFPSFDQDTSFKNEKNDVIHSKDQDDEQDSGSNGQYSDGQSGNSGRQGASYDDDQYGHQHGRSEYDQGSDRDSSDSGSYDGSDSSNYQGDRSGSNDDYSGSQGGSNGDYSSSSSSSDSSDGNYSGQDGGSTNDYQNSRDDSQDQEQYQDDKQDQSDSKNQADSNGREQAQYEDSQDQGHSKGREQAQYEDDREQANSNGREQAQYEDDREQANSNGREQAQYEDDHDQAKSNGRDQAQYKGDQDQQNYQDSNDHKDHQNQAQSYDREQYQGDEDKQEDGDQQGEYQDRASASNDESKAADNHDTANTADNTYDEPAPQEQQPTENRASTDYQPENPQPASSDESPVQSADVSSGHADHFGESVAPIHNLPADEHLNHDGHDIVVDESHGVPQTDIVSPISHDIHQDHDNHADHIAAQIIPQHIDHDGIVHADSTIGALTDETSPSVPDAHSGASHDDGHYVSSAPDNGVSTAPQ